jgi:hypothetical protein
MYDRKERELFVLLYETASSAGIEVIEDKLNRKGGVCRVDGRVHVIFDEQAPYKEKNRLILNAIGKTDLDATYLPPKVRVILDRQGVPGVPDNGFQEFEVSDGEG